MKGKEDSLGSGKNGGDEDEDDRVLQEVLAATADAYKTPAGTKARQ